jgi:hypothetical protein
MPTDHASARWGLRELAEVLAWRGGDSPFLRFCLVSLVLRLASLGMVMDCWRGIRRNYFNLDEVEMWWWLEGDGGSGDRLRARCYVGEGTREQTDALWKTKTRCRAGRSQRKKETDGSRKNATIADQGRGPRMGSCGGRDGQIKADGGGRDNKWAEQKTREKSSAGRARERAGEGGLCVGGERGERQG